MLRAFVVLAIGLLLTGCQIKTTLEKFATNVRDQASNAYGVQLATESVRRIPNGGSSTKAHARQVEEGPVEAAAAGAPAVSPDQAATDQAIINAVSAAASYQAEAASSASAAALAEPAPAPK